MLPFMNSVFGEEQQSNLLPTHMNPIILPKMVEGIEFVNWVNYTVCGNLLEKKKKNKNIMCGDFCFVFRFWDRILLYSSGGTWAHYLAQDGLEIASNPPALAFWGLGLHLSTTAHSLCGSILFIRYKGFFF